MKKMLRKGTILIILPFCFPILANAQEPVLHSNNLQNSDKLITDIEIKQDKIQSMDNNDNFDITANFQTVSFDSNNQTYNEFFDFKQGDSSLLLNQQNQILFSNNNKWYLPNNNLVHIEKIIYRDTLKSSAQYNNGRFSAKTGFYSDNSKLLNNRIFYLQSSLVVLNNRSFNLTVSARLDEQQVDYIKLNGSIFDKPIYTSTLGIVGIYELNKNWQVSGALTATAVNEKFINGQVADQNQYNQALIGTTYSF